ncbi:MAG TPA: hypothetical protein VNB68_00400 [Nitrososphaeraceae archaeon]|nr:hypothetical protein [Nitrososphaeraceae archaeon]
MPILQIKEIIDMLRGLGIQSRVGVMESDIDELYKPYYEQWLGNRDGFIKILTGNIDYVGTEEIMRLGPFHNMYCLIHNSHLMETHPDHPKLLNALPCYKLNKGKVDEIGWNGSILAERLNKDNILCSRISRNIVDEEVRSISIRVVNYGCLIQTKVWDPKGFVTIYDIIDSIGKSVKNLLEEIHIGEEISN